MKNKEFTDLLEQYPQYQHDLFIRGFLVTNCTINKLDDFPFYGNWQTVSCGNFSIMTHKTTGIHVHVDANGCGYLLLGHAYNPFILEHDEDKILRHIADAYGSDKYQDRIDELTGVFAYVRIDHEKIDFLVDPSGMQSACYGVIDGFFYLSSHPQLIGDLCGLKMDPFVQELVAYKWYGRVMGPYLPGDLTPFSQVKRIVPNIAYQYHNSIQYRRIWPLDELAPIHNAQEYQDVITAAANILKNNLSLIPKKWARPSISLTGGIDSNTTFAAANGYYDQYKTFSYISAAKEVPDAEAAAKIAKHFDIDHIIYQIPDNNEQLENFDVLYEVLFHNNGYVARMKDNEARKRMYLRAHADCDVEVKSWASETIRCYWHKHFGRNSMPPLSPKLYRNLYKIFLENRTLAHKVDAVFDEYIHNFGYDKLPLCYPAADMHFNEVTWGSWGGLNISEMKYCFDVTVPYSNRKLFELLFRVPMDQRISDQHHLDMKKYLNKELYDMGIRVVNMKETNFRAFALNIIFTINQLLPF